MKERPILFRGPMVSAIIAGTKTQTRRLSAPAKPCPYGEIGDRLWVRETFALESNRNTDNYPPPHTDGRPVKWVDCPFFGRYWLQPWYRATDEMRGLIYDDDYFPTVRWRPSIFLPRWASRLTLEITDLQCEFLNDISEDDAIAEGVKQTFGRGPCGQEGVIEDFAALWDSINGKTAPWDSNPVVWAISFRLVPRTIGDTR